MEVDAFRDVRLGGLRETKMSIAENFETETFLHL